MSSDIKNSMIPDLKKDEYFSKSSILDVRGRLLGDIRSTLGALINGFLPLLVFTALNEVASNLVFVSLMDSAYIIGRGARSVGVVLIIQCISQLTLGSVAGSFVDRWGTRKMATIGTISQTLLTVGLIFSRSVAVIYILAFHLMLARLLIIPARLAVVRRLSSRRRLLGVNTVIEFLTGAGLFLGPSIGAILVLLTQKLLVPPVVAGFLFLGSAVPSLLVNDGINNHHKGGIGQYEHESILTRIRRTWRYIKNRRLIRILLLCRIHSTMLWAAVMPLLTPLSRNFGLAEEGTGVFVAAIGLGNLVGPVFAPVLFKRMKLSLAMLITGLMGPIAAILISLTNKIPIFVALVLVAVISLACAGLKVIVNMAFQRLTPEINHGAMFGAEQTMLGLAWTMALAGVTILMSPIMPGFGLEILFLFVGLGGLVMFFSCWILTRRELQRVSSVEETIR